MTERQFRSWSDRQVLALAGGLLVIIGIFHLGSALAGKPIYRDSHLGTAIEYAKTGIDLLNPVIVGFNATGTPTPQEFPLWQGIVALGFKTLGPWFGWANLISLIMFSTCLFPLFQLARIFYGERCARWTLVFFLAEPLVFLNAGTASTDGFSLAAAIWFAFLGVKLLEAGRLIWWLPTFLAGALAALCKLPFFMTAGLAIFFLTIRFHRTSLRAWVMLGTAAACIALVFRIWTVHTDGCIARSEFTFVDLRASAPNMIFWYFGDWKYRLSPWAWLKGAWRILNACFGSIALAGAFGASLLFLRQHLLAKFWLAGAAITTLIFTHLVLHHWHYYLMFTPAVALVCASAATAWEKHIVFDGRWKTYVGIGLVALALLFSIAQGLVSMHIGLLQDSYPRQMASLVSRYTKESDRLLIAGGGWGGDVLFLANRRGLSIWDTKPLENPQTFQRLKELGYNKLVLISASPLFVATVASSGGGIARDTYASKQLVTPAIWKWPTIFEQKDDLLIKDIP
jgi:hypothetical protein